MRIFSDAGLVTSTPSPRDPTIRLSVRGLALVGQIASPSSTAILLVCLTATWREGHEAPSTLT